MWPHAWTVTRVKAEMSWHTLLEQKCSSITCLQETNWVQKEDRDCFFSQRVLFSTKFLLFVCLSKFGQDFYWIMEKFNNSPSKTPTKRVAHRKSILMEPSSDNHARNYVKQEQTSRVMKSQLKETEPTKWTDEKHSLYLNSMEASFVNQLHDSLDVLGWHSLKYPSSQPKSSSQKHTIKHNPRGQFKFFQDGCWRKISFGRGEAELTKRDERGFLSSSPWIQHYRSGCRRHTNASPSFQQEDFLANGKDGCPAPNVYLCHQDSVGCNTGSSDLSLEVTDQNFIDEDSNKEEKSKTQSKKMMKTTTVNLPAQDQVVPSGKCFFTEDVAENNMSSKV